MIVLLSHASKVSGKLHDFPAEALNQELCFRKENFVHVQHALDGEFKSILKLYEDGSLVKENKLFTRRNGFIFRYFSEISTNIKLFYKLKKKLNKNELLRLVAVDPLNAIAANMYSFFNKNTKVIFYTADYTKKRFENKLLNFIYHFIDKLNVIFSDEVWAVSHKIQSQRIKDFGKNKKFKLMLNLPKKIDDSIIKKKKKKHQLITLGLLDKQLDFFNLFDAIFELKKKYKKISLLIAGDGPVRGELEEYVKIHKASSYIKFLGYLDHKTALNHISQSEVGCALYNGNWSFNVYGDSMKCREYVALGLGVLTTNTHSTVLDIENYKVGYVANQSKDDYVKGINYLFKNMTKVTLNCKSLHKFRFEEKKRIIDGLCRVKNV